MRHSPYHTWRDITLVVFSVIIALFLAQTEGFENFLTATKNFEIVGSFIAGLFFTSAFTTAPAIVALAEIAKANSLWPTVVFGAIGAVIGDLVIFRFVKNSLFDDVRYLLGTPRSRRLAKIFHLRLFRWLLPLLGALVIASPFPDELGVALLGLSQTRAHVFLPVSFLFNMLGIFIIGTIARGGL